MIPFLASLSAIALILGIWLLVTGLIPQPVTEKTKRPRRLTPAQRRHGGMILTATVLGGLLWLVTGYFVALPALPALALLLPYIVPRSSEKAPIERLNALEEWTRSLSAVLGAQASLEQAIIASRASVADPIKREVGRLVARLQAGVPISTALESFADDLDDPTGDVLAGSLLLGSFRRGPGLAKVLDGAAEMISDDVASRREIEADRAKPRANARIITIIAVVVLLLLFVANPTYVEPYQTLLGQLILSVLTAAFLASLWWMNMASRTPKGRRILRTTGGAR